MNGGIGMEEEQDLKTMVDEDIVNCEYIWKAFSHDKEQMEHLFHTLLFRYLDLIDGFAKDIRVISNYESPPVMAEVYRLNVSLLSERLKAFKENGYVNEGLDDYYIRAEEEHVPLIMDFTLVRLEIGVMENLSLAEREEIMNKITMMESICSKVVPKRKKWEMLRAYVVWISGKDVNIAMKILPLFLKIN